MCNSTSISHHTLNSALRIAELHLTQTWLSNALSPFPSTYVSSPFFFLSLVFLPFFSYLELALDLYAQTEIPRKNHKKKGGAGRRWRKGGRCTIGPDRCMPSFLLFVCHFFLTTLARFNEKGYKKEQNLCAVLCCCVVLCWWSPSEKHRFVRRYLYGFFKVRNSPISRMSYSVRPSGIMGPIVKSSR